MNIDPSLNEALATLGYTTDPGQFQGMKKIKRGLVVCFEGRAHHVWEWLRRTGQHPMRRTQRRSS